MPARSPPLAAPQAETKTIILYIINKYELSLMYNKQASALLLEHLFSEIW